MKTILAFICFLAAACDPVLAAPPGKGGTLKPQPQPPSHARLVFPDGSGRTYGSAVPWKDDALTVAHAEVKPGQVVRCEGHERTVKAVVPIIVAKISPGAGLQNRSGDLVFLDLESPFPSSVRRAVLAPAANGRAWVTHKDGRRSARVVVNKATLAKTAGGQALPPDYLNPRWLHLAYPAKPDGGPLVGGDSGGAITDAKGRLISLVSRVDAGQGPNLCHKDLKPLIP